MKRKVVAMIPARMGSTRLAKKNLAMLNGQAMIEHVIHAAQKAEVFDDIYINSENMIFETIAKRNGVKFYQRDPRHATSEARSDEVVEDFIKAHACDILVWVNSIAPLQPPEEIAEVVTHFLKSEYDTLITVKNEQVHCVMNGKPLNFDPGKSFARTQDLPVVQPFVYSLMMWKTDAFMRAYREKGYAILSGHVGYYPVGKLSTFIVKREEDLRLIEYIMTGMGPQKDYPITYDDGENNGT